MTNGAMGAVPDDLALFQAARWLHVAPWELAKQPVYWRNRAHTFMGAEESAREQLANRHNNRAGRG